MQANNNTQETICMQTNCIPIIPIFLVAWQAYKTWKDMDSSILRFSAAYAQQEVFLSPNNIFSLDNILFLSEPIWTTKHNVNSVNRKGKEATGCVILNLSAACARNYHFLGQTIIFEGRESFLTRLKCVQIKNKPICAKQNISSLSTVSRILKSQ